MAVKLPAPPLVIEVIRKKLSHVIVPVAGVAGVPVTVYVNVVVDATVIVNVPLYSVSFAPAIVKIIPVFNFNPFAADTVAVAV